MKSCHLKKNIKDLHMIGLSEDVTINPGLYATFIFNKHDQELGALEQNWMAASTIYTVTDEN